MISTIHQHNVVMRRQNQFGNVKKNPRNLRDLRETKYVKNRIAGDR